MGGIFPPPPPPPPPQIPYGNPGFYFIFKLCSGPSGNIADLIDLWCVFVCACIRTSECVVCVEGYSIYTDSVSCGAGLVINAACMVCLPVSCVY